MNSRVFDGDNQKKALTTEKIPAKAATRFKKKNLLHLKKKKTHKRGTVFHCCTLTTVVYTVKNRNSAGTIQNFFSMQQANNNNAANAASSSASSTSTSMLSKVIDTNKQSIEAIANRLKESNRNIEAIRENLRTIDISEKTCTFLSCRFCPYNTR